MTPAVGQDGRGGADGKGSTASSARTSSVRGITKRDGRRVAFDPGKIRAAVWRAMQAVGDGDEAFAEDVAAVVTLALEREASLCEDTQWSPTIETIQDRVERALVEMGRAGVAKAYILYRDRRSRARDAQSQSAASDVRMLGDPDSPRVRRADSFAPWSRGRIAAALVNEADMPRDLAARIAAVVEARVLASGLSEVSTSLVRALVDHELVASGMVDALRHTEPIALPRHDLRRLASSSAGPGIWEPWRRDDVVVGGVPAYDGLGSEGDLQASAGAEVLRRFALTEVLDRRSAELHANGDLHVSDLRRPQRYLHLGVPHDLLVAGAFVEAPEAALVRGAELLVSTTRGLTFDEAGPLVRAACERGPAGFASWLVALAAVGRAAGQRICLRADDGAPARGTGEELDFGPERAALVLALARLRGVPFAPRVWMDVEGLARCLDEDATVREATLEGLERGWIVPSWHRGEGRPAGPGAVRMPGERGLVATAGAVALNLPRLAQRVGAWNEQQFMEELFGLLSCALEAGRSLASFQDRCVARRAVAGVGLDGSDPTSERPRTLFARTAYALVPVGLPEALRILSEGELDAEQGARILGLIAEAAARFPEPGAPRVEACPLFGSEAARRLAWADRTASDGPRAHQAWLFAEMSGRDALVRSYTPGYAAGASAAWRGGEAEAELVRTLPSGVLHPPPSGVDGLAPSVQIERFVSLRRAALARSSSRSALTGELLPLGSDSLPLDTGRASVSDSRPGEPGRTPLRLLKDDRSDAGAPPSADH
ncbi:Ribonucleoside-diphosphate reductase NrdZ [Planctomycetes bacterium Pla163]|uniref:Ribonucleoside-diphosphate reductase NrdZ n=1 Tax=Rohdeia mirabilis TaxID=2528008 RepID=A0A518D1J9_9BACT|nr:Ribonucleoside-diphosphate reductase NrdZ [Planctomycetes bacterium Pla163]